MVRNRSDRSHLLLKLSHVSSTSPAPSPPLTSSAAFLYTSLLQETKKMRDLRKISATVVKKESVLEEVVKQEREWLVVEARWRSKRERKRRQLIS